MIDPRAGRAFLVDATPDKPFALTPQVTITASPVPHRDEFADTVGYRVAGPLRSMLCIPDIDRWDEFDRRELPHQPISETMDRLQDAVNRGAQVFFSHLNHTNPALRKDSPERAQIETRGFHVLDEGSTFTI